MTLDWSPLAIATVALACVAVWSILQTRATQSNERRQRLLNEIIAWAEDILRCGQAATLWEVALLGKRYDVKTLRRLGYVGLRGQFDTIYSRDVYIGIAASAFTRDLQLEEYLYKARRKLYNHLKLLDLACEGRVKNPRAIGRHRTMLDDSARKVIEEATKIKTRDIG